MRPREDPASSQTQAGAKSPDDTLIQAIHKNDQMAVKLEAVRRNLHIPPEKTKKRFVSAKTPLMEAVSVGMNAALPYLIADAGAVLESTN